LTLLYQRFLLRIIHIKLPFSAPKPNLLYYGFQ